MAVLPPVALHAPLAVILAAQGPVLGEDTLALVVDLAVPGMGTITR